MFIQPCFIRKNTKELCDKLIVLGYKEFPYGTLKRDYLFANNYQDGWYDGIEWHKGGNIPNYCSINESDLDLDDYGIDCGTNEDLFLALAALRDDSDYMQYFITEVDQSWVNQGVYAPKGSFELCLMKNRYPEEFRGSEEFCNSIVPAHKATVKELIEHFKKY